MTTKTLFGDLETMHAELPTFDSLSERFHWLSSRKEHIEGKPFKWNAAAINPVLGRSVKSVLRGKIAAPTNPILQKLAEFFEVPALWLAGRNTTGETLEAAHADLPVFDSLSERFE